MKTRRQRAGACHGSAADMRIILIAAVARWSALPRPVHAAGTFYVDNQNASCSISGPGTISQPYCTISAAAAAHNGSGTTIIVMPGIYREQVTVPASGASGSPFVIQASGPGVIVDGADDFSNPALWSQVSGTNTWLAATVNWTAMQVLLDGARLTPATGDPTLMPSMSFQVVTGTGLYVNAGGGNPGSHAVLVSHRTNGFRINARSYVNIQGFTVTRANDKDIYVLSSSTNISITGNTATFSAGQGIGVFSSTSCLVGSNVVSNNGDHGIILQSTTSSTVADNESFGNARPTERAANGLNLFGSSNNQILRNRWHDNQDSGEQYSSSSNNNLSIQNRSWKNGDHGFDHLGSTGIEHIGCVAWKNFKDGFSFEGSSPSNQLYNCIATDNGLTTGEFDLWVDGTSTSGF